MKVHVANHPLISHKLTVLRDEKTDSPTFRRLVEELVTLLAYEATRDVKTTTVTIKTPVTETTGLKMAEPRPVVVPILRAGLGMLPAAMELLPDADIAVVGVQRDEKTHEPSEYVAKLPSRLDGRTCLVLDPMLATGGSLAHGCKLLADRGAPMPLTIACVLAAPEGIEFLRSTGMNLHIITASVDSHLNENAFIVPGLGDAGDRQFGPPH